MNRCPHCNQNHAAANHFCPVTGKPIPLGSRLVSTKLLDKYTVVEVLGEGPVGVVLEVEDNISRKRYAAKLIHPMFTRDPEAVERLMADIGRMQSVKCEHIAQIVQVGRDTGAAIVVIRELMAGESLSVAIRARRFSLREAVSVVRQILVALDAVHRSNILDLDLSPSDVLLVSTPNGPLVKVLDIGERHLKQALPGDVLGADNYNYYAPEQLDKSRQPNLRSDIYAAGAVLYQMLSGVAPAGNPAPVEALRKDVLPDLARITAKAIAPTPNNRYQSASEFIQALDAVNWDLPSFGTRSSSGPHEAPRTASSALPSDKKDDLTASVIVEMPEIEKRSPLKVLAAILVILLIGAGGIIYFMLGKDNSFGDSSASASVLITIDVIPSDAVIYADGKRVTGTPPVLKVSADTDLHTISAKAEGFESVERDVRFDQSKTVRFELMEIIPPDEPSAPAEPVIEPAQVNTADPGAVKKAGNVVPLTSTSVEVRSSGRKLGHDRGNAAKTSVGKLKKTRKTQAEKKKGTPSARPPVTDKPKEKNLDGFRTANPFE